MQFRFLRRHDNDFSIITKELDVFKIKERLRNDLEEAEKLVDKIMDPIYPIRCDENAADGSWVHENPDCLAGIEPEVTCGFKTVQECERKLDRLELLSLPLLCFQDPEKAVDQRTLEGMAQESCIYRTS
jgi:hypothetical protein